MIMYQLYAQVKTFVCIIVVLIYCVAVKKQLYIITWHERHHLNSRDVLAFQQLRVFQMKKEELRLMV
jgi:hypothetical protein